VVFGDGIDGRAYSWHAGFFFKVRDRHCSLDTYVVRGTSPFARTGFVCISSICVVVRFFFVFFGGLYAWQWDPREGDAEKMMIFETKSQALRDLV
jgi:hypothetical protein